MDRQLLFQCTYQRKYPRELQNARRKKLINEIDVETQTYQSKKNIAKH